MMRDAAVILLLPALALMACSKPAAPPVQTPPVTVAPTEAGLPPAHGMVMLTTIVITSGGSDQLIGFRILVGPNGDASHVSGDGAGQARLPDPLSDTLKADVDVAKLAPSATSVTCAAGHIPVSVSQGSYSSGDLACPTNDAEKKLSDAVTEIVHFLKLRNVPKGQGTELPPRTY